MPNEDSSIVADLKARVDAIEAENQQLRKDNDKLLESLGKKGKKEKKDAKAKAKKITEERFEGNSAAAVLKKISFALGAAVNNEEDDETTKEHVRGILATVSDDVIDKAFATQGPDDIPQINPHYAPPTEFGTDDVTTPALEYLKNLTKMKNSHEPYSLERTLKSVQRTFDHFRKTKKIHFSRDATATLMAAALPQEESDDLAGYLAEEMPLEKAWKMLIFEHGSRPSTSAAQNQLQVEKTNYNRTWPEMLTKLKSLSRDAYPTGGREGAEAAALAIAKEWFAAFTPQATLLHLFGDSDVNRPGAWARMRRQAGHMNEHLEHLRQRKLEQIQGKAKPKVSEVKTEDPIAAAAMKIAEAFTTSRQVADGPRNPQRRENSGYHYNNRPSDNSGYHHNGRPSVPVAGDIRDYLSPEVLALARGRCFLCFSGEGDSFHQWQSCPSYPGAVPMRTPCRCGQGLHPAKLCRNRPQWNPRNQNNHGQRHPNAPAIQHQPQNNGRQGGYQGQHQAQGNQQSGSNA